MSGTSGAKQFFSGKDGSERNKAGSSFGAKLIRGRSADTLELTDIFDGLVYDKDSREQSLMTLACCMLQTKWHWKEQP